jgi:hypothetical protein
MTKTGLEIVFACLRTLNAAPAGQTLSAQRANDGLECLNGMLDAWAAQRKFIHVVNRELFNLVAGDATYTIGPGGNFNRARPVFIDGAGIVLFPGTEREIEYELRLYTSRQWAKVGMKNIDSTIPWALHYDGGFPLRTITLYPEPRTADPDLALYLPTALTELVLTTEYTFPPGYYNALKFNGAVQMGSEFGRPAPSDVREIAALSIATVKRSNEEDEPADLGLPPTRGRNRLTITRGD